jgi:hypothetical protein
MRGTRMRNRRRITRLATVALMAGALLAPVSASAASAAVVSGPVKCLMSGNSLYFAGTQFARVKNCNTQHRGYYVVYAGTKLALDGCLKPNEIRVFDRSAQYVGKRNPYTGHVPTACGPWPGVYG